MMKISIIKIWFPLFLVLSISSLLFSQGKGTNGSVAVTAPINKKKLQITSRTSSLADTISIGPKGLLDDFSYLGAYPDTAIWLDSMVYVNRGYGISPPSIGVATFDGLAANGYPYSPINNPSVASSSADSLTSKPIDLSSYTIQDSLYFSFYYQAQGRGNNPETDDSLVLEFKAPGITSPWRHIWSQSGYSLGTDSTWNVVMIAITDPLFVQKGFQFRFRNYATINADADQWNIDYVYLNTTRNYKDTIFTDVTWIYDGTSLLKNYRAMPWKQYTSSEITSNVYNLMKNNNFLPNVKVDYYYKETNVTTSTTIDVFNGGVAASANIFPFSQNKIYTDCGNVPLGCISSAPIVPSKFPTSVNGPTQIAIKHYFNNSIGDFCVNNDTLTVVNNLTNYFAYDDGGAESEAGLVNALNGQLAIQYKLNVADTLSRVEIYFDPFITNAELYTFYLNVWSDNGGIPGKKLFTSNATLSPKYLKKGQNVFTPYDVIPPLVLNPGTFYVGFTQNTDQPINIGLDLNNNSQNKAFVNVGGGWINSSEPGSLMIHPIFGYVVPLSIDTYSAPQNAVTVYPNPVNDKLYFKTSSTAFFGKIMYEITDMFGRTIMEGTTTINDYIDVSSLSAGVCFIRIIDGQNSSTNKFIKIN